MSSNPLADLTQLVIACHFSAPPRGRVLQTMERGETPDVQNPGGNLIVISSPSFDPTEALPVKTHRLTSSIRIAFVKALRTPALLAMFAKDSTCASNATFALRGLASLEPTLIMPEILERAYSGLEVVNETHRTTAVLESLTTVGRFLVSEHIWLGGQKHLVPLLELTSPGIDLVTIFPFFMPADEFF
jgi:hypothetical protein